MPSPSGSSILSRCETSNRECARFLQIAAGSAAELHYHLRFAMDSAVIPHSVAETLLAETTRVRKMLFVLLRRVREASGTPTSDQQPRTSNDKPLTASYARKATNERPKQVCEHTETHCAP
jgi:hypothetical protein